MQMRVAFVSTHLPRRCGLATFNGDLMKAMKTYDPLLQFRVARIEEPDSSYPPDSVVHWHIDQSDPDTFAEAAIAINASGVDVVVMQHEFGLFGTWNNGDITDEYNNYL